MEYQAYTINLKQEKYQCELSFIGKLPIKNSESVSRSPTMLPKIEVTLLSMNINLF